MFQKSPEFIIAQIRLLALPPRGWTARDL